MYQKRHHWLLDGQQNSFMQSLNLGRASPVQGLHPFTEPIF